MADVFDYRFRQELMMQRPYCSRSPRQLPVLRRGVAISLVGVAMLGVVTGLLAAPPQATAPAHGTTKQPADESARGIVEDLSLEHGELLPTVRRLASAHLGESEWLGWDEALRGQLYVRIERAEAEQVIELMVASSGGRMRTLPDALDPRTSRLDEARTMRVALHEPLSVEAFPGERVDPAQLSLPGDPGAPDVVFMHMRTLAEALAAIVEETELNYVINRFGFLQVSMCVHRFGNRQSDLLDPLLDTLDMEMFVVENRLDDEAPIVLFRRRDSFTEPEQRRGVVPPLTRWSDDDEWMIEEQAYSDQPIGAVLRDYGELFGLSYLTHPAVYGYVTLRVRRVPWDLMFSLICEVHGIEIREWENPNEDGPPLNVLWRAAGPRAEPLGEAVPLTRWSEDEAPPEYETIAWQTYQSMPLDAVLRNYFEMFAYSYIKYPHVYGTVYCMLQDVPSDLALNAILEICGYERRAVANPANEDAPIHVINSRPDGASPSGEPSDWSEFDDTVVELMAYRDQPLPNVLRDFSEFYSVNMVLEAELADEQVTLEVENESVGSVMRTISEAHNLTVHKLDNPTGDPIYLLRKGAADDDE